MEPLDLRAAPPRSPHAELAGITFLPRSIDKVRASLPGGNLGEYSIEGFTEMMLEKLGVDVGELTSAVAGAATDDDVAAFVSANADAGGKQSWNAYIHNREVFHGDRVAAIHEIPWLAQHPEIVLCLDMLAEDDRRMFAEHAPAR